MAELPDQPVSRSPDAFYSGAYDRIICFMIVLGIVATLAVLLRFGTALAAGFLLGCAIAFLNFHWLKRVISALADRATATGERQSSAGVVARFLLRYFLIALSAYAIFKISRDSLYGLLAGLFLPVGAILMEAGYELYAALRRGV
ncbi:MAG: ATP synthase subunit I [Terriglobales bacterium]